MSGHWDTPILGTLVTCERCERQVPWETTRRFRGEWGNEYHFCGDCVAKAHDDQEAAFREQYGDSPLATYNAEGR